MTTVTITEAPPAIADLLAMAGGARVELDDLTRAKITASRGYGGPGLTGGETVYGLTTQVGHGKGHPADRGRDPPRAALPRRVAQRRDRPRRIGRGVAVAEILAAMLNAGVHRDPPRSRPPTRPPRSGAASVCAPGSVYSDRRARSCVMPSICPAASLSNW